MNPRYNGLGICGCDACHFPTRLVIDKGGEAVDIRVARRVFIDGSVAVPERYVGCGCGGCDCGEVQAVTGAAPRGTEPN